MKIKSILTLFCLLTFAFGATAQNRIKLFDAVPIGASDTNIMMNADPYGAYTSVEVYLSCPTSGTPTSTISGPNGGDIIADNYLLINDRNVCGASCFAGLLGDPMQNVGSPVETSYVGISPINVSGDVAQTGLYTFTLIDLGFTYGNNELYLNTSCSIIPVNTPGGEESPAGVVCHRNNGTAPWKTLNVGPNAVAAHLAHGDTAGPCAQ